MQRARFLHLIIHAWTRDRTRAARVTSECPTTGLTACVFVCQDSRLDKRRVTNIADCYASKARETPVCKSTPLLHESRRGSDHTQNTSIYCITPIFRVEEMFAIFANLDFARNFPPAKIISTANGISRNFPPAKFSTREIFRPAKIKF